MDLKELKRLVNLVETANISGLKLEQDGFKVEIKKETSAAPASVSVPIPVAPAPPPPAPEKVAEPKKENTSSDQNLVTVKAPMVGTFYGSPNPDAAPYVKVGDRVSVGATLCIIEAMKLFNEIESEYNGVVEKVLIDNQTPVEYGKDLFVIRKE